MTLYTESESFWMLLVKYPWPILLFLCILLCGSYIVLKMFGNHVTVWICRMKKVRILDGKPWDQIAQEETDDHID